MSTEQEVTVEAGADGASSEGSTETPEVAAEGTEAPAAPEAPKVEPPKQEELRAAKIAAVLKREKQFRDQQSAWQKEREQQAAAHRQREEQFAAQQKEIESVQNSMRQFVERMKADPIAVLRDQFGIGPEQYYQRVMNDGKPAPEELQARELSELKRQIEEQKAWRSNFEKTQAEREAQARKAYEDRQKAAAEQEATGRRSAAESAFLDALDKGGASYSDLLLYPKDVILKQASALVDSILDEEGGKERIQSLSVHDLAKLLNEEVREWHQKVRGGQQTAAVEGSATPPNAAEGAAGDESLERAIARKTSKVETTRHGQVRTANTLNGNLSARASVKSAITDFEAEKRKLVADLEKESRA